jgi:NADH-quinone oxidoreductase subunit A
VHAHDQVNARHEASMIRDYVPLLVLSIIAGGFAVTNAFITLIVGPFRPTREKLSPYESGITEIQPPRQRFSIKFYVVAMMFLLFDIEALSFFPWSILLRSLKFPGFIEMLIFIAILVVGFIFVWKKGALDWE